jgi:hypothetical protein
MAIDIDPMFEQLYGGERSTEVLIPWDIGGPQPVVQQLVAVGAVHGEVLDPGTDPGITLSTMRHKAIRLAVSTAHPRRSSEPNATLSGPGCRWTSRSPTRPNWMGSRAGSTPWLTAPSITYSSMISEPRRDMRKPCTPPTKPDTRLFMFEVARHNVNGLPFDGLPADNFERVFGACGGRVDYVGHLNLRWHVSARNVGVHGQHDEFQSGHGSAI